MSRLFLESNRIILRCTKCGLLRLETLGEQKHPHLRLVERSYP